MELSAALLLALAAFFVLVLLEAPIGLAVMFAGALGVGLLEGLEQVGRVLAAIPYSASAKYSLFVVPMYILLGALISNTGIGTRIYSSLNRIVGRLPGGLAATAVLATTFFSGISGSTAADIAAFGRVSIDEMGRHGYARPYGAAVMAAAGTFAVLVPPSVVLVIYGILANVSIGAMILAGVVPGLVSGAILAGFVVFRRVVEERAASRALVAAPEAAEPDAAPPVEPASFWTEATGLLYGALLFAIVVGGLYAGFFTATEAGAVGAFAALLIAVGVSYRRRQPMGAMLREALHETATVTSMIFLLLVGGAVMAYFLVAARVPTMVAEWALELPIPPLAFVGLCLLIILPLGMFLDGLSIMLMVVPVAAPVVSELGFSGVWFGVLVIKMVEIGLITPPVGMNVFIVSGISKLPPEAVFRAVTPFVILDLLVTAVFFAVPEFVLWLPRTAGLLD